MMINKHWNECTNEDKAAMKNEVMIANNDDFFDCNYAAAFITSTPNSLQKWRSTGRHKIPFFKVGRKIYYYKHDLVAFMKSKLQSSTVKAA